MCTKTQRNLCDSELCGVCHERSFASHPKAKYWSKKNKCSPRQITQGSAEKCWFDCPNCPHDFEKQMFNIKKGSWCPYCARYCHKVCGRETCVYCYNRSFASHPRSRCWSRSNPVKPSQVTICSNEKYLFDCECGHTFPATPGSISHDSWCPYCSVGSSKLCDAKSCLSCHNRSFASHPKAQYWSMQNTLSPRDVTLHGHTIVWFTCSECGHDFDNEPHQVARSDGKTSWCPYCANQKLCDQECNICFDKSFASHSMSKYWSEKNTLTPRHVFKRSGKQYWLRCDYHHDFKPILANVTKTINPTWCPKCNESKGEKAVALALEEFELLFQREKTFPDLRDVGRLRFDFYLTYNGHECVIEYDGQQHFHDIVFYKKKDGLRGRQTRDLIKTKYCLKNNINIIRIPYTCFSSIRKIIKKLKQRLSSLDSSKQSKFFCDDQPLYIKHIYSKVLKDLLW
jgi:Probable Zinc-ribbon domain